MDKIKENSYKISIPSGKKVKWTPQKAYNELIDGLERNKDIFRNLSGFYWLLKVRAKELLDFCKEYKKELEECKKKRKKKDERL